MLGCCGRVPAWVVVAALPVLALPGRLDAQAIRVQLRESEGEAPVAGALVKLLEERVVVRQALSDAMGRAVLAAPAPGRYRIRVDQIGASGFVTDPIELAAGEVRDLTLRVATRRVMLPPIEVTARSRCGRVQDGGPVAALWEEVSKALTASRISEQAARVPLLDRRFRRILRLDGTPLQEWTYYLARHRGPYYSASLPAEILAREGFLLADRADSVIYAVPDAALLLSDAFVSTHCFRAASDSAGLAGLTFEPVPGRREADIRGTLWVYRETSELRFLEFSYTGLSRQLARLGLGGKVTFQRLAGGTWIVSEWMVRMPETRAVTGAPAPVPSRIDPWVASRPQRPQPLDTVAVGLVENGGVLTPLERGVGFEHRAIVTGRVMDSTIGSGLAGVLLVVPATGESTVAKVDGTFDLRLRTHGEHVIQARHAKFTLPQVTAQRQIWLSLGDTVRVDFTIPSARAIAEPECGRRKGQSGVVGQVLDPSGAPAAGVAVRAEWQTSAGRMKQVRTRSGRGGLFALCNLPSDAAVEIQLLDGRSGVTLRQPIETEWGEFAWMDLRSPILPAAKP